MPAARNFTIKKRLSLEFFGEGWNECYVDFRPLNMPDFRVVNGLKWEDPEMVEKNMERVIKLLEDHFIEGKVVVDGSVTDMRAEDIASLPTEFTNSSIGFLVRSANPTPTNS